MNRLHQRRYLVVTLLIGRLLDMPLIRTVDLPLLHQVLVHPLALPPASDSQRATVRSLSPNAATIACVGQPWHSSVSTNAASSAGLCSR